MLNNFEYWDDTLNDIERGVINNIDPPRLSGYRLGYITANIERAFYNNELALDDYNHLKERSEKIYLEVKR